MTPATKKLLPWLLLILILFAVAKILGPAPPEDAPREPVAIGPWLLAALGGVAVFAAVRAGRRFLDAVQVDNDALGASNAHVEAGRFAEAEQVIEALPRSVLPQFRRVYHAQRAWIAASRGARDEALRWFEAAIATETPAQEPRSTLFTGLSARLFRGVEQKTILAAHALRSLVRASAGDEVGVREDVAAIRADPRAAPVLLAWAALAEARLLDEEGDRTLLGAHLERIRPLLFEAALPRQRALFRAYEAMLEANAASVYRDKGDRRTEGDEAAALRAWVALIAPNAAPFVRAAALPAGGGHGETDAEAPTYEAQCKVEAARPDKVGNPGVLKTAVPLGILSTLYVLAWALRDKGPSARPLAALLLAAAVSGSVLALTRVTRRWRRERAQIANATQALDAGDLERARAELAPDPASAHARLQVALLRAEAALRRGEMAEVVAQCDAALVALAQHQGGKLIAPAAGSTPRWDDARRVAAQRAFALAALGRGDEAWAEIAWAQGFPGALPVFRVLLVTRLVARDYEGAARAVEARDPAMALPARDEALAACARFVGRPEERTVAEARRLRAELRRDRSLDRWIEAAAPGLTEAMEHAAAEVEAAV